MASSVDLTEMHLEVLKLIGEDKSNPFRSSYDFSENILIGGHSVPIKYRKMIKLAKNKKNKVDFIMVIVDDLINRKLVKEVEIEGHYTKYILTKKGEEIYGFIC